MDLDQLGFTPALQQLIKGDGRPARVVVQAGPQLFADAGEGVEPVTVPGRFRGLPGGYPVVGDWVLLEPGSGLVTALLPRQSALQRKVPGVVSEAQVLAANINTVLLVAAADALNLRRLQRMLSAAWDSGALPAVVITKTDLVADGGAVVAAVEAEMPGVPVLAVAARLGKGLAEVRALVPRGSTAVMLGSSGAGKSTLLNALTGEDKAAVGDVRADGKGRHTTVRRQVHGLPGAGLLVDTPGIRELQLWDETGESVARAFGDILELALQCKFSNCAHRGEPGCAVMAALKAGTIQPTRLDAMRRMEAEIAATDRRVDARRRADSKREFKAIERSMRRLSKHDPGM